LLNFTGVFFMLRIAAIVLIALSGLAVPAAAQFTTPDQTKRATPVDIPNKAPDMVCFGEGPNWSVQLEQGRARYLGINEPDYFFNGKFVWVPDMKIWTWQGQNSTGNGQTLSVNVSKATCIDKQRNQQFPYKAQATLPAGDMVSGCCRKLHGDEAAVGADGYIPPKQ
jgi:uncharacterized membrane protein